MGAIMILLKKYLLEAIDSMEKDSIRLKFFGDMSPISPELRALAHETDEITEHLDQRDFQANICLNYGGRDEILRAVRRFASDCAEGKRRPEDLDEAGFSGYLDSAGIPDPELIIRPSGELRLSNFLLWQCAYSEFYCTDTLWPDFDEAEIDRAVAAYQKRDRRFGGVK
ncbi:Isoprenyl transferase [bioreactor metagenome]|uniref:Isoprenyl transferase n=1 Tax=bioreactor metagenome TaxID=1076179 RepID=A0A645DWX7_9ZZZZ